MELQPLKTFRASSNQASLLNHQGQRFLVKRYVGPRQQERRNCEEQSLQTWSRAGFKVPGLATMEIPELRGTPYLVMDYLDGPTLQEYLRHPQTTLPEKTNLLARIFRDNCRRHALACQERDPHLLHPDPNSSNVIYCHGELYFIDFETAVAGHRLQDAIAIEIAKFSRWTARDFGIAHLPELMRLLVDAYAEHLDLLRPIVTRTCERPFQFFHRWQDRRRKRSNPGEVTKYDIADALRKALDWAI